MEKFDRLAPNLAHMLGFIWKWTARLSLELPFRPILYTPGQGVFWLLGGKKSEIYQTAGPNGTKFDIRADSSGNGHKLC